MLGQEEGLYTKLIPMYASSVQGSMTELPCSDFRVGRQDLPEGTQATILLTVMTLAGLSHPRLQL